MRFAAIADIHGNDAALAAVLSDIDRLDISEVVNLGDHLSGPLNARSVADTLIDRGFVSIRGNHDRWLIEQAPRDMAASDRVAFEQLDKTHLGWLESLPVTSAYRDEIFLCHGTPDSDTTYWLESVTKDGGTSLSPIDAIEREAGDLDYPVILCGHTHIPRSVRLRDGRIIVNPGSVGCPGYVNDDPVPHVVQAGTPDASYAILEKGAGGWSVTFRLVPYDTAAMVRLAHERSRPEWASAIATGWILK